MSSSANRTIDIVLPYLNSYRAPMLDLLRDYLAEAGIELSVHLGLPTGGDVGRNDSVPARWEKQAPQRTVRLPRGGTLIWRKLPRAVYSSDLVVVEQAVKNVDTYLLMTWRHLTRHPTASWGHGRTITRGQGRVARWLQRRLLLMSSWFFGYTAGSARRAVSQGFPPGRITVLNNSTDTRGLRAAVSSLPRASNTRPFGALYIGALDGSKRTRELVEIARQLGLRIPGFKLIIAGDGPDRDVANDAGAEEWLEYVGRVDDDGEKAALAARADIMLVAGRVGLVAVDALALGLPVAAFKNVQHAPEFEYLDEANSVLVEGGVSAMVDAILSLVEDRARLDRLKEGARATGDHLSVEETARRFCVGLLSALGE